MMRGVRMIFDLFNKPSLLKKEDGFSLLEILLVVGVFSAISIGIVELTSTWTTQQKIEKAAAHIRIIHAAAESYIDDNFAAIESDALAAGGTIVIPIDDDGVGLPYFLKEAGTYLPVNFNAANVYRQTLQVLVRRRSATRLEAMVVSTGRTIPIDDAALIANTGGHEVGIVSGTTVGDFNNTEFSGSNAAWTVPLADYAGTGWLAANPIPADGAHLAALLEINLNNALDNYLYRIDIAGSPEANRMQVDLDMDNNTINNTSELSADFADVQNNLNVLAANADISQGLVGEQALQVNGPNGRMEVTGLLDLTDMVTNGSVNVGNAVTVNQDITGNGIDPGGANFTLLNATNAGNMATLNTNQAVAADMDFTGAASSVTIGNDGTVNVNNMTGVNFIQAQAVASSILQNVSDISISGNRFEVVNGADFGTVNVNSGLGRVTDTAGRTLVDYDETTDEGVQLDINVNTLLSCPTATNGSC